MILNLLFQDPLMFVAWLMAIVYGITVHEFSHAWAATWQGDDTARLSGRLTLNPLAHLDMVGMLMLVLAGFGWGKPVPVNPYNLKRGKLSDNLVSLAGIIVNLVSVFIFGFLLKFFLTQTNLGGDNLLINFLYMLVMVNLILAVFNLIPIPPLDGSHILMNVLPERFDNFKARLTAQGPFVLLIFILADNFLNLGIFSSLFQFFFNLVGRLF
ncbi:MAG: site-2 protease family protein [Patescibacteria group bacterium]|jgi:Zn-dependent protease